MRFYCSISRDESTDDAVEQVVRESSQATGGKIDVAFAFFTAHHRENAEAILERLWLQLDPQALIGCSAEGVIGRDVEIEREPGIAVLVGELSDVRLHPFHIAGQSDWRQVLNDADELKERLGVGPQTRAVIALGDPFTTPLDPFLAAMDAAAPGVPVVGGMASSSSRPGGNVLFRNDQTFAEGLVGLSFSGPLRVRTIVSQGCRPFGDPLVITRSRENVIEQLGGKPALKALQQALESMPEQDRRLVENGLFVGRAISEYRERFGRGDFLIRNVVGVDQERGAVAIADYVRTGQTVQFHVRDAQTADEDLAEMLANAGREPSPAGGLLFSCNGRGTRLFEQPCHDIRAAHGAMPRTPIAGFFAAGEIGPIGGKNFVHGHTASFALFEPER